jgi:hypothetical protein
MQLELLAFFPIPKLPCPDGIPSLHRPVYTINRKINTNDRFFFSINMDILEFGEIVQIQILELISFLNN